MKPQHLVAAFFLAGAGWGCAHVRTDPVAQPPPLKDAAKIQTRNNAASLLRDLLDDEKNVAKVFVVKNGETVKPLVMLIAATAAAQEQALDGLTNSDPRLNLHVSNLPPGEQAARDSEAKTTEHELLFSSGAHFEFNLLLTQAEALNYGWHLATVAAEDSPEPEANTFKKAAEALRGLYGQTIREMRSLPAE